MRNYFSKGWKTVETLPAVLFYPYSVLEFYTCPPPAYQWDRWRGLETFTMPGSNHSALIQLDRDSVRIEQWIGWRIKEGGERAVNSSSFVKHHHILGYIHIYYSHSYCKCAIYFLPVICRQIWMVQPNLLQSKFVHYQSQNNTNEIN